MWYSLVIYENQCSRVKILCPNHGEFTQNAKSHTVSGSGCSKCARESNSGWTTKDWEKKLAKGGNLKLYYLECWNEDEQFYKIGLTSKDKIEDRFYGKEKMPYQYCIIKQIVGEVAELVKLERGFKKEIISLDDKYIPKIKFNGSTYECFKGKFLPDFS